MRRISTILFTGMFLTATIGLPGGTIFAPAGSEDFPCRGHGCGCVSAEMCRTNCCCVKKVAPTKTGKSCCRTKLARSDSEPGLTTPEKPASAANLTPIQCKGQSVHWVALSVPVHESQLSHLLPPLEQQGLISATYDDMIAQTDRQPTIPPPRV